MYPFNTHKVNVDNHAPINMRKYKIGDRVRGVRSDSFEDSGTLVDAYVTLNKNWGRTYRNPAYVVLCDSDGKRRVYQGIRKLD